ncbi:hypothetical protein LY78DRAFT_748032 [Colletotrichum sublineola]|nr:hypothetical protein LY78DRAFT_748032 [Colletotrichum sublineola]
MTILSVTTSALLPSVDLVAATDGIANVKIGITLPVVARMINLPTKLKRSIGSRLAPKTLTHDNPLKMTEQEAHKHGHKLIPVELDLWDELEHWGVYAGHLVPRLFPGFRDQPSRGWVFDNTCMWIGENVPAVFYDWQEICSKLKYVTLFWRHPNRWLHMAYAGHYYSSYDDGWEIYYPHGKEGTQRPLPPTYYYHRYFNCSAT